MSRSGSSRPRVLLVDDDDDLLHLMSVRLAANGLDVDAVNSAERAIVRLGIFLPHVVVTDLRMQGLDGMALFETVQQRFPGTPVIILTAHGTIPDAVAATQQGVFGYLTKPFDREILLATIERALRQRGETGPGRLDAASADWRREIISRSAVMESVLQQAGAAAASDVNVLIQSQTGTGKELLARAIHRAGARRERPFLAMNCAALPEPLLESEMFGHNQGAFTGATRAHAGLFQAADGGTVFLDEIGDMPMAAQAKLLRVVEQHEVRPVGATRTINVDVRIIAATHQDLESRVAVGEFREDLYYRLNVVMLELPPLASRREDISLLANHFRDTLAAKYGRTIHGFSPGAMEILVSAPWPGNVRQLLNVVEQCVVLSPAPLISAALVQRAMRSKGERLLSFQEARQVFERDYLVRMLQLTEGNVALAARLAERNRSELYRLLQRHGLEPEQFRTPGAQAD
jgi:two-component system response regulator GlrR